MQVAGRFRTVRRRDRAVPEPLPRAITDRGSPLDVRIWSRPGESQPLLLVTVSRKQGSAVQRNLFRRRVRMAFLDLLRGDPRLAGFSGVVWVRPSRKNPGVRTIGHQVIEYQLRLAFSRRDSR